MQVLQMESILRRLHPAQGVCQADVRLQARYHTAKVKVMMLQNFRWQPRRIRNPDLHFRVGIGEPLRKHADDRVWLPVEMDLPPDNRWIAAEPPLEQIPCKHDGISVRTIFALAKRASDDCIHSQQRKQVPTPAPGAQQFRQLSALPGQGELPPAPRGHVFKAVVRCAPVVIVGGSNGVVVELLRIHARVAEMFINHHQPIRITERKRLKQDRTHHREQRCRSADAQRHYENGNDRKPRRTEEGAKTDPEIAKKTLQPVPTPDSASLLADKSGIAERTQGGIAGFFWWHAVFPLLFFFQFKVRL